MSHQCLPWINRSKGDEKKLTIFRIPTFIGAEVEILEEASALGYLKKCKDECELRSGLHVTFLEEPPLLPRAVAMKLGLVS